MGDDRDDDRGLSGPAGRGAMPGKGLAASKSEPERGAVAAVERSAELDVKALWGDLDEGETEIGGRDWSHTASQVLNQVSKPSASSPTASSPRATEITAERVASSGALADDDLDDLANYGSAPARDSSSGTDWSLEGLKGRAVPVRGLATPAMAVPNLRPPSAAPPPLRASSIPPDVTRTGPRPASHAPAGGTWSAEAQRPRQLTAVGAASAGDDGDEEPTVGIANNSGSTLQNWPPTAHLDRIRSLPPLPDAPPIPALVAQPPIESVATTAPAEAPGANPVQAEAAAQARWWIFMLAGAALIGLLVLVLSLVREPPAGALVINATGPGSQALPHLRVYVDAQLRCSFSPCRVTGLSKGSHEVRAEAPNHTAPAASSLTLEPGTDRSLTIQLTPVVVKAALNVSAKGSDLVLWFDGKELGTPPQLLNDIEPGDHVLSIRGPRFVDWEEKISLAPGQQLTLGPLKPRVKLGQLSLRAGAEAQGARVTLDGKLVSLPATLDLPAGEPHVVVATKSGFDRFETSITFPDGKAEAQVEVALMPTDPNAEAELAAGDELAADPVLAGERATLHLNSIPPSNVLLDGKPLGQTPRLGVVTRAGQHVVTFIHASRGKKSVTVRVAAGQAKTVSTRF